MMTLDEAIKHAEEVMVKNLEKTEGRNASDPIAINCFECAEEHKQLAGWLKELKQLREQTRWIPMVRREPTDEEKAEYFAQNGEELCYMLENKMPLNGQEVLVSIGDFVSEDVFDEDFYNFECSDIENVDAWMPKPKPYEPQESEVQDADSN